MCRDVPNCIFKKRIPYVYRRRIYTVISYAKNVLCMRMRYIIPHIYVGISIRSYGTHIPEHVVAQDELSTRTDSGVLSYCVSAVSGSRGWTTIVI
jgi:hypothetical protein